MSMTRYGFPLSLALILSVSIARAEEPKPIRLLLTPAKPPTPALRYQLLPDARMATSGNAADIYHQVIELLQKKPPAQESAVGVSLREVPLHRLPKEDLRKELAPYDDVFALLDKAARCDYCDFGFRERLREKGIAALLPELQPMRSCAVLLALKARLAMADGHNDKALATLRTGLALARHTGENETLIAFLVGTAIEAMMQQQLDTFVGLPDAPNLYNALTDLPTPLISMRRGLESERLWIAGTFPGLGKVADNLDAGNLSESELKKCVKLMEEITNMRLGVGERILVGWNIQQKHEIAKKALIAAGRPREKVEAMPPLQVAILHALLEYDAAADNLLLLERRPYWEWTDPETNVNKRYLQNRWMDYDAAAIPLTQYFLPAIKRVTFARARMERKMALLRTIEAIRYYADDHHGQLPPNLAAIKEVPIPIDPVTGKDFIYQLDGDVAKLTAPTPTKETPNVGNMVIYELAIRK
jgi:hypothetical protein